VARVTTGERQGRRRICPAPCSTRSSCGAGNNRPGPLPPTSRGRDQVKCAKGRDIVVAACGPRARPGVRASPRAYRYLSCAQDRPRPRLGAHWLHVAVTSLTCSPPALTGRKVCPLGRARKRTHAQLWRTSARADAREAAWLASLERDAGIEPPPSCRPLLLDRAARPPTGPSHLLRSFRSWLHRLDRRPGWPICRREAVRRAIPRCRA